MDDDNDEEDEDDEEDEENDEDEEGALGRSDLPTAQDTKIDRDFRAFNSIGDIPISLTHRYIDTTKGYEPFTRT